MIDINQTPQKAVLFGMERTDSHLWGDSPLEELERLADTAGAEVVGRVTQRFRGVDSTTYIGSGKAEEVRDLIQQHEADIAIFDDDLSPSQARNLEDLFEVQVLDRSELILDIFAHNARTVEARLQVELAQLEYLLPRLKRMWVHLSRIRGGIGLRGPGETQLETDRRIIQRKIADLKHKLVRIENQHAVRRSAREKLFNLALVGYTNAGKSSLLHALSGADILVRDQLFSTLDTTTRRVGLEGGREVLLTDTVGFINHLPHHLVASFKATLHEVAEADHLLLVVDVASPHFSERITVVNKVLGQIGAGEIERTLVFNKVDRVAERHNVFEIAEQHPGAVFSSAARGDSGVRHLRDKLLEIVRRTEAEFSIDLRPEEGRLAASLHEQGHVLERRSDDSRLTLRVRMRRSLIERLLADSPHTITYHGGDID
ncbi:GTPase HflX [bacterium]|nr:GTPase HflX [bacterium]